MFKFETLFRFKNCKLRGRNAKTIDLTVLDQVTVGTLSSIIARFE